MINVVAIDIVAGERRWLDYMCSGAVMILT
jgi:hypothetical protein